MQSFGMDGNVTLNLVIICFMVAATAVGITLWAVWTFQTKVDAKALEDRVDLEIKEVAKRFSDEIQDIHNHLNKTRNEIREDIKTLWVDFSVTKNEFGSMARDIAYIKGLLEPRPPKS